MKRFVVFILAILYLGLSTGATINMHYCMGELVGTSLWHNDKSDFCSQCGMQKKASKNKCCKDELKIVKIEQDQCSPAVADHFVDIAFSDLLQHHFNLFPAFVNSSMKVTAHSNAPPLADNTSLYIRNCVFRI